MAEKKVTQLCMVAQVLDKEHPILGFFHAWVLECSKRFDVVHVICLQQGTCELPAHVHVYSLGKEKGASKCMYVWRFYKYLTTIFFTHPPTHVFFHMGAIFNVLAAPFFLIRTFTQTRFYWWKAHGHINWFGRLALRFVDRVYTSTESGFPIVTPKRRIVGQAIDDTLFSYHDNSRDGGTVLYVGRIAPVKQLEVFLETMALLKKKGFQVTPQIVGPVVDEVYFQKLLALASHYGFDDTVFLGSKMQTELVSLYQDANVFLNTSLTHSMDKTVLEAMLCGCIPVTANKAFVELLDDLPLYTTEATALSYVSLLEPLLAIDHTQWRTQLRERVVAAHTLTTFPDRIFGID